MANTTNFGWETPDDTDLVKDGAAAIRTLGSAIDTSLADLEGGTTGQILAKNSNTDMDFIWVTNDVGDITEVNVSSPITGGGTSGAVTISIQDGTTAQKGAVQLENSTSSTSTTTAAVPASVKSAYDLADGAIAKSLVDAKGDLIVGTADNTVARLASSASNGNILTVDTSTASGLKWAAPASSGGMTLLSTTTLTGASTITISTIDQTYNNLFITIFGVTNATGNSGMDLIPNGTGSTVTATRLSTDTDWATTASTNIQLAKGGASDPLRTNANNVWQINLFGYSATNRYKSFQTFGGYLDTNSSNRTFISAGLWRSNTAISSFDLTHYGGNFTAGTVLIYGVK